MFETPRATEARAVFTGSRARRNGHLFLTNRDNQRRSRSGGREICVALLGNPDLECLPFVEMDFGQRCTRLVSSEDKYHVSGAGPDKLCPANVDQALSDRLRDISFATFRGSGGSYVRAALASRVHIYFAGHPHCGGRIAAVLYGPGHYAESGGLTDCGRACRTPGIQNGIE